MVSLKFRFFVLKCIREDKLNLLRPIADQFPSYDEKRTELETKIAEVLSISFSLTVLVLAVSGVGRDSRGDD